MNTVPASGPLRTTELLGVAAHESRDAVEVADQTAIDGAAHDVEGALQSALDLVSTPQPFVGLGAQRQFAEREVLCLGSGHRIEQGIEHQATRSMTRRVLTAVRLRMRSSAAGPGAESSS